MHGISHSEVYTSVWRVVDAVNKCNNLRIEFPDDHDEQHRLARGFRERSQAHFDCCVAAIDGLLIWTERPSNEDCRKAKCGPKKFFCGRKKKFGLNLMGTVDYLGRFLDVQIQHPASTSDFLAFATSDLKAKLDQPGFLSRGLVIFGDNAYSNSEYMVTPFKGSKLGSSQDSFNFYHSQLRIHVECAFGRLVHRWGVLRRPISQSIGIKKTGTMVLALCRLHNFCTNMKCRPEAPLDVDLEYATINCGIDLNTTAYNDFEPTELLHGGEHRDDVPRNVQRQLQRRPRGRRQGSATVVLPQAHLHDAVVNMGLQRPTPRSW
jgi:DDE superfamily endonuclease